jgi:hypothetical protein
MAGQVARPASIKEIQKRSGSEGKASTPRNIISLQFGLIETRS